MWDARCEVWLEKDSEVGRKERYQVLFSVLDFLAQPNLVLQQLQSRCYDNVIWEPREQAKWKKTLQFYGLC